MDGIIAELMRRANQPLIPQISEGWDALANQVNDPNSGSSNVPLQTAKGAIAGMMQGVGRAAADATSPLGLAGLLSGTKGVSGLAKMLKGAKSAGSIGQAARLPAEFTAVGAEAPYVAPHFADPMELAYKRVLARGGR